MIKNVIPALKPTGGEFIELVIESEEDAREYRLIDAARLIHHGGRWDSERVGTDDEMMDPTLLAWTKRSIRPRGDERREDPGAAELLIDGDLTNFWGVVDYRPGGERLGDVIIAGIRRLIGWKCTYVILSRTDDGDIRFQAGAACPEAGFTTGRIRSLNAGIRFDAAGFGDAFGTSMWEDQATVLERARSRPFPPSFGLATWNLERLRSVKTKRGQRVELLMRAVSADVWVLTETSESVRPGPDFQIVSTRGPDEGHKPDERWAAICSRFPIDREIRTSEPLKAVAALIAPPEMAPFVVYGVVLPTTGAAWYGVPAAGGRAFVAGLGRLYSDMIRIRNEYPGLDIFVAGDFNQDLADDHHYGSLWRKQRLKEVLNELRLRPLTAGSDDPIRAGSPPYACIDHICTSGEWRVRRSVRWPNLPKPLKGKLSDHFGVAVEIVHGRE